MSTSYGSEGAVAPVLDEQALARLRELDPTDQARLLDRVFAAFETSAARLMPQLAQAREARDLAGIRFVAHTLKSSSASIGALRLSQCCERIEHMAKTASNVEMPEGLDEMTREMDGVLAVLRRRRATAT